MPEATDPSQWIFTLFQQVISPEPFMRGRTRQRDRAGASIEGKHPTPEDPTKLSTNSVGTAEALQGALGENQRKRNPSASVPPEMA